MVIFKVVNTTKKREYFDVSLNGYNFAKKVRHILYGRNDIFNRYYPIYNDILERDDFQVVVCKINVPKNKINQTVAEMVAASENSYNEFWEPIMNKTIDQHYRQIEEPSNISLFIKELYAAYTEIKLTTIVYDYIYHHAAEEWLWDIFNISPDELNLIMDYLAFYINTIDFKLARPQLIGDRQPVWRRNKDGVYCVSRR